MLTPFLRQGLERGEKVLYVVDDHSIETILSYLRDPSTPPGSSGPGTKDSVQAVNVESYLASGQLVILTSRDTYLREGAFDPDGMFALLRAETERALDEGYPALRGSGEMTWALRGVPGSERLIEYEAQLNEFLPDSQCLILCQYDRRRFDQETLWDVLRTHPTSAVGTVVYHNLISESTLKNTTQCPKEFSCLYGQGKCFGEVEYAVGDEVFFVDCTDRGCIYRHPFGRSYMCTCPTRKEIYGHYRI